MAKKKPLYEIRDSDIHDRGVFAAADIPKDKPILQYVGERISKKESERRAVDLIERAKGTGEGAVYIFTLNDDVDIDGAVDYNDARLINHSCDPNCEALIDEDEIWIYSLRKIRKGEELSYNYGFDLDCWEDHPCLCGTDNCVGFIVGKEHWGKLRKMLKKLKEKAKARKEKEKKKRKKREKKK